MYCLVDGLGNPFVFAGGGSINKKGDLSREAVDMQNGQLGQLLRHPGHEETLEEPTDSQLLKRFASQQDEAAFAALVRRHGPMVLAVCRRVLHDPHDAEDAFQATFLVLVRKAQLIARPELLGNWLYGVAYRVAVKARANAARRSEHERRAPAMALVDPMADVTGRELRAVLDVELSHLPEKYRAPLVLCYLEGKTNEQAARLLGWPTGSMSGRLARARELLRKRLVGRGLALSAGVFTLLLSKNTAAAAVPQALLDGTVRGAVLFSRVGPAAAKVVSPSVWSLMNQVLESLRLNSLKRKIAQLLALFIFLVLGSVAAWYVYVAYFQPHVCS
jgi:RNA polymerase sigma factor (sigma-70 family)